MRLGNWGTVWLDFEFDPRTSGYSYRIAPRRKRIVCGFGAVERTVEHGSVFFCLYRSNERLVFQAGERRWWLDAVDLRPT